jgi:hypothetical protein
VSALEPAAHLSIASALPVCYLRDVPPCVLTSAFGLQRRLRACAFAMALAAVSVGFVIEARATEGEATPATAPTPSAPPGDGATAARIIKDVEAKAKDARMAKIVAEPLGTAKKALQRANSARTVGDAVHARMLDGLALEWAEVARDLQRAAAAEDEALAAARKARDLDVQLERARALLEETQARRGRAAADLERAEAAAKEAAKTAAGAETERVEKGRKKDTAAPAKDTGAKPGAGGAKPGTGGAKKPAGSGAKRAPKDWNQ